MRIYISGPISDCQDFRINFERAKGLLESKGHTVINPAHLNEVLPDATHEEYMSICIQLLELAEGIYMLNGWQQSKGATAEYWIAQTKRLPTYIEDAPLDEEVKSIMLELADDDLLEANLCKQCRKTVECDSQGECTLDGAGKEYMLAQYLKDKYLGGANAISKAKN